MKKSSNTIPWSHVLTFSMCKYSYLELAKWWIQNEKSGWILWREYLNICLKVWSNQKWNKIFILFDSVRR